MVGSGSIVFDAWLPMATPPLFQADIILTECPLVLPLCTLLPRLGGTDLYRIKQRTKNLFCFFWTFYWSFCQLNHYDLKFSCGRVLLTSSHPLGTRVFVAPAPVRACCTVCTYHERKLAMGNHSPLLANKRAIGSINSGSSGSVIDPSLQTVCANSSRRKMVTD